MARPRLSEVAARAGVSEKTVSNVINNYPHVTVGTRAKVEAALAELDYKVNLSARSLASGRTGFIAFAAPGLDNPYFAELAGHIIRAAAAQNWTVLIEQTGGNRSPESEVVGGRTPYLVDGIILHPEALTAADIADRSDGTPIVLIGEQSLDGVADHVAADNVRAALELTNHMIGCGRRRIATIGIEAESGFATSALRYEGYFRALTAAGITVDESLIVPVDRYKRGDGAGAMAQLLNLRDRPDAVICFNDVLAIGALSQLHRSGVEVPREVAVAGFDNIEEAPFSVPPLTTISWDMRAIAEMAVALLSERQGKNEQRPRQEISIGHTLTVRASTIG